MSRTDIVKVHKAEIIEIDPKKKYILTLSVSNEYTHEQAALIAKKVKETYAEYENMQLRMYREGIKIHIEQHG